jgi:Ca2+-dependent lipid-binding protein
MSFLALLLGAIGIFLSGCSSFGESADYRESIDYRERVDALIQQYGSGSLPTPEYCARLEALNAVHDAYVAERERIREEQRKWEEEQEAMNRQMEDMRRDAENRNRERDRKDRHEDKKTDQQDKKDRHEDKKPATKAGGTDTKTDSHEKGGARGSDGRAGRGASPRR